MESRRVGSMQQALLYCGIVASLLFVVADVLAVKLAQGYDFVSQSMGALSAVGAPTRPLVVSLNLVSVTLIVAFGIGLWRLPGASLLSRVTAMLEMGQTVVGLLATIFFAPRFGESPVPASTGVILGAITVVLLLLAIGFGAAAFGGWFRALSVAILAGYVILAALRLTLPFPDNSASLVGVQERTMAYSSLVWAAALAVSCITSTKRSTAISRN